MSQLTLEIITQERQVFQGKADALTAPATQGQVTILPGHIPLFTKLNPGELKIFFQGRWKILVVAGGFMDVAPKGQVTVLADSAVRVEEISIAKAETAKRKAEEKLKERKLSDKDFTLATSELRRAIIELNLARKYRRRTGSQIPGE